MIAGAPSFLRLFRRSRYIKAVEQDDQSEEALAARQEIERFVVAALAFCLKHDPNFLSHFWERICQVPDADPPVMPNTAPDAVLLEPPHWADLRILSHKDGVSYMWVVEVKTGAHLEPRQRPDKLEFSKRSFGYGALFSESQRSLGTRMRYIILGAREDDNLLIALGDERLGILVQKRSWADLAYGLERIGVVDDFCQTLGELGIEPFHMENAKAIVVASGINNVGKAWKVLTAICDWLDVPLGSRLFLPDDLDDAGGTMGIYIKAPSERRNPSQRYALLKRATRAEGWCLSWFGYKGDLEGTTIKSVWFYFDSAHDQTRLFQKVKPRFPTATADRDGDDYRVIIEAAPDDLKKDFDWFQDVFQRGIQ